MYLRWDGDRPLADREMVAALYHVSERSVRRHCTVTSYEPRTGQPAGVGGLALYDALVAADALAGVAARPERTVAALLWRIRTNHARAGQRR